MKKKIAWFSIISIFSVLVLMPVVSLAQTGNLDNPPPPPITTVEQILELVGKILGWFATIFWIFAVGAIFYAAFLFLTASDNPERVKKAKKQLLYAVIAIAIGIIAYGVPSLLSSFLGGGSVSDNPSEGPCPDGSTMTNIDGVWSCP